MSTSKKLLMFYKGTALLSEFKRGDPIKVTKQLARDALKGLRELGNTDMGIIALLSGQLNVINDALCEHYGSFGVTMTNSIDEYLAPVMEKLKEELGVQDPLTVLSMWSMNIAILIEIKFLKDDDMNGYMFAAP
jgi:hypothetical protein